MKLRVYRCSISVTQAMMITASTDLAILMVLGVLIRGMIQYIRNATIAISTKSVHCILLSCCHIFCICSMSETPTLLLIYKSA